MNIKKKFLIFITCISFYYTIQAYADQAILDNKIILCTGPAYGKRQQLIDITNQDAKIIPFKKIFVITNDPVLMDISFDPIPTQTFYFLARGKQLDCLNCIINAIKAVANDSSCLDDDILLFKHESVYISDMYLIMQALHKIDEGYDMVIKNWIGFEDRPDKTHLKDYCHTDCFFMKVSSARKLFKNHAEVTCFVKGDYHFCEEYFTKYIVNVLPRPYKIDYRHSAWKDNELGFYHIPRYEEDPDWYWNKENYHQLYK